MSPTMNNPQLMCEHAWVSIHQPDLPIYWVRQCSQCGYFDPREFAAHDAVLEAELQTTKQQRDERVEECIVTLRDADQRVEALAVDLSEAEATITILAVERDSLARELASIEENGSYEDFARMDQIHKISIRHASRYYDDWHTVQDLSRRLGGLS